MNWSLIFKDFKRNKGINFILFLFIVFSSVLIVLSSILGSQTIHSIQELYRIADPPHFLQMHKGELDMKSLEAFMSKREEVIDWQVVETISISSDAINLEKAEGTIELSDFKLDIGLVKQNDKRDLLLNYNHQKVQIAEGEIGIPILMKSRYDIQLGDRVVISNGDESLSLVVREFVLDAQMNSPLTSSTRILLSDKDYQSMYGSFGEIEYLIEAYFKDNAQGSAFKSVYENAGMPQNGQAVTYQIIFLLSAMTDIIMVFVLIFASALVIMVSFICLKFTILSTLEEELMEIGTMKAIGFSFKHIRNIYLDKYRLLTLIGMFSGLLFAYLLKDFVSQHIESTFGKFKTTGTTLLLSLVSTVIIYGVTMTFCRSVLRKIKKLTVVETLVYGEGFERIKKEPKASKLTFLNIKSVNILLSFKEVMFHFRKWLTVFLVIAISFVLMSLPMNLLVTFEHPQFITYMGSSVEDILVQVEESQYLEENYLTVKNLLETDDEVATYFESRKIRVKAILDDGEFTNIDVDSGNEAGDELKYLTGMSPTEKNEIAISYLNSEMLGKSTGDTVRLIYGNDESVFTISGVYQDVTSGGLTAKSKFDFPGVESKRYAFSVNLTEGTTVEAKAEYWSQMMGYGVSVDSMETFVDQTLGGVIEQLRIIVLTTSVLGIFLASLITLLFLKLRVIKDYSEISILKAIGFSNEDLRVQYLIKTGIAALFGVGFGFVLTRGFGQGLVNLILGLSGLGLKKITLMSSGITDFVLIPLALLTMVSLMTLVVIKQVKNFNLIALINE